MAEFDLLSYMNVPPPPSTPKSKPSMFSSSATPRLEARALPPRTTGKKEGSIILTPARTPLDEKRDVESVRQLSLNDDDVGDSASIIDNGPHGEHEPQMQQYYDEEEQQPNYQQKDDSRRGSIASHDDTVVDAGELCDNCVNKHLAMAKWARAQHDKDKDIAFHKEFEDRYLKQREDAAKASNERKQELADFVRKSKEEREAEMARRKKLEEDERKMDREMIEAARRQMEQETDQARAERQQALRDGLQRQIDDKRARQESEAADAQKEYAGLISPSKTAQEDAKTQKQNFRLADQIEQNRKMRTYASARERDEDEARMRETMAAYADQSALREEAERRRKEDAAEYEREIAEKRERTREQARREREEALEGKRIADQLEADSRRRQQEARARSQNEFADTLANQLADKEARRQREREAERNRTYAPTVVHEHGPMTDCAECGTKFELRRLLGSPARAALDSWKKYLEPSRKEDTEYQTTYN